MIVLSLDELDRPDLIDAEPIEPEQADDDWGPDDVVTLTPLARATDCQRIAVRAI